MRSNSCPTRRLGMIAVLLTGVSRGMSAQAGTIELGVDGMVQHAAGATTVNLPVALFRIGFFLSPQVSVEPFFNVNSTYGNGSFTSGRIGVGALWHFTAATTGVRPYVRPFVEDDFSSVSVTTRHVTQGSLVLGAGLGLKLPLADRLRWRLEAAFANATGESSVMGLVGFSFFTR